MDGLLEGQPSDYYKLFNLDVEKFKELLDAEQVSKQEFIINAKQRAQATQRKLMEMNE